MPFLRTFKRELKRRLTVMFIPHNSVNPLRLTFSFSFLLFLVATWTGLTLWAGYLASRHIDYWKVKADNKLMNLKVVFFAEQVKKSHDMLEQVKENDSLVRSLLEMKSKKAIIESESEGKGGPTGYDREDLERVINGTVQEMSQQDIARQTVALQEETRRQIASHQEILQHIEDLRVLYRATPSIWPCVGHLTSRFGFRLHPIYNSYEYHSGLDIANVKNTSIYATADGYVKLCDWQPGYGRLIIVDHGHGYATYYGHLQKILVRLGEKVRRGQLIGLMGSTGTSTGTHLHYEIQYSRRAVNPVRFLKKLPQQLAAAVNQ